MGYILSEKSKCDMYIGSKKSKCDVSYREGRYEIYPVGDVLFILCPLSPAILLNIGCGIKDFVETPI